MARGHTRTATWSDVPILAPDLREADKAEIAAGCGLPPNEAISVGIRAGQARVACLNNGYPVAVYGVVPGPSVASLKPGVIWMLATNGFKALHTQFLREGGRELDRLTEGYDLVYNFTDARNSLHHRWLRWMGFTFIKTHPQHGVERRPFLEFVRITGGKNV
jgi:hypothetical protein